MPAGTAQADLDNYWLRAPTYSQLTGRFLSRDPMPNGNLYIYPGNNPVMRLDPSGSQPEHRRRCPPGREPSGVSEPAGVLIPKTSKEIWLNRVRVWLPPLFVLVAIALRRPEWNLWGIPFIASGEGIRTWAAGHLVKDQALTVGGPYAHVRNPLYLGSLLNTVGFLVILGDWALAAVFVVVALAIYVPTIRQEEDYLRRMHGDAFEAYRRAVPGIVPRLRPARVEVDGVRNSRFEWRWVLANEEHRTWLALLGLFGLLGLRTAL